VALADSTDVVEYPKYHDTVQGLDLSSGILLGAVRFSARPIAQYVAIVASVVSLCSGHCA